LFSVAEAKPIFCKDNANFVKRDITGYEIFSNNGFPHATPTNFVSHTKRPSFEKHIRIANRSTYPGKDIRPQFHNHTKFVGYVKRIYAERIISQHHVHSLMRHIHPDSSLYEIIKQKHLQNSAVSKLKSCGRK